MDGDHGQGAGDGIYGVKYVRGLGLIARQSDDGFGIEEDYEYYALNAHGDVAQLADGSGEITKHYEYDAFGVELDHDDSDRNPFRYCGEYWDNESGTYYLRARYFNPRLGRFTTEDAHWNNKNNIYGDNPAKWYEREPDERDPLGLGFYTYKPDIKVIMQSSNLYAYCINNPVIFDDPSGEFVHIIVGAAIGAVALGVINYNAQKASGGQFSQKEFWASVGIGAGGGALVATGVGAAAGIGLMGGATAGATAVGVASGGATISVTAGSGALLGGTMIGVGGGIFGLGAMLSAEHTKNARPSTENKHQKGQTRKQMDQGGEKKEQHPSWKPNPNKKK